MTNSADPVILYKKKIHSMKKYKFLILFLVSLISVFFLRETQVAFFILIACLVGALYLYALSSKDYIDSENDRRATEFDVGLFGHLKRLSENGLISTQANIDEVRECVVGDTIAGIGYKMIKYSFSDANGNKFTKIKGFYNRVVEFEPSVNKGDKINISYKKIDPNFSIAQLKEIITDKCFDIQKKYRVEVSKPN
jgi:Ca2+/Na+ antiporter